MRHYAEFLSARIEAEAKLGHPDYMTKYISKLEACEQGLPGSDTLRDELQAMYFNDQNRLRSAFDIYKEAYKSFIDSRMISKWREVVEESKATQKFIDDGFNIADRAPPPTPHFDYIFNHWHLENLKIASGFELSAKALLLSKGIIVNIIDNRDVNYKILHKEQKFRPVLISEIKALSDFVYEPRGCFLPGVTENSLNFSTITKEVLYKEATGLSDFQLDVIEEFRMLRNKIHLTKGSLFETKTRAMLKEHIASYVAKFINKELVMKANEAGKESNLCEKFFLAEI